MNILHHQAATHWSIIAIDLENGAPSSSESAGGSSDAHDGDSPQDEEEVNDMLFH